jgi:hypothetical protein
MKHSKQDLDAIIDNMTRDIRDEQIDPAAISQSASRVWAMVSQQAAENFSSETSHLEGLNNMNPSNNAEHIRGCEDFQSLIPAYLEGSLSPARKLLLEDHSNECIPCRQELKAQKSFAANKSATYVRQPARKAQPAPLRAGVKRWSTAKVARWSVAAALVVCLGVVGLFTYERLDLSGTTLAATVESADGLAFVISDEQIRQLAPGEELKKGERIRTAKDSNAVLKLRDGSTIEMRERSEFSVSENMRGVTVQLDRGDVIVEAAKQDRGRLYVKTPDSTVTVKGTIFAVESGTKGSRVSVVEGEVKVDHAGKQETLLPGDQATTSAALEKAPVEKTVAWSRKAAKYANLVTELAKLRKDVNQKVARPGVRHSSKFIDLLPENTVFFASLPNLSETLAQSQKIMQERIKQNPALAEWSKGNKGHGLGLDDRTMSRIYELGSQLGDEIVVSGAMDAKGEPTGILVLGQVKNAANFRTYLDGQLAKAAKENGDMPNVRIIEDPMTATASVKSSPAAAKTEKAGEKKERTKEELFVWINNDIFAASPQIESLRGFATTLKAPEANKFAASPFRQRIADVYSEGAGLVVAADLERIVGQVAGKTNTPEEARHVEGMKQLGVMNLRHFVAEQKDVSGRTLTRAALTFSEANKGIASWLAAPGSMGALDFISPNANVVAAFVVKEPALLVDDLFGFMETVDPDIRTKVQHVEQQQGLSIRNDFAAPLGGEFAFAIDGPLLPTPSWKVIMEVYDQAKLQDTFQRAIEKLNQFSMLHGKGKLAIESTASGDRTFYAIKSADAGLELHYTFSNGYFIAAQTRALLEQALNNRDAGSTLSRSSRFMSSLPQDGNANFSAILYHDLAPLMQSLGDKLKNVGGEEAKKLGAIDPNAPPTLVYAYAQGDRITFSANTEGGAFGLSPASLIGLPNSFEMQHILMNAMGEKDVQKKSE